MRKRKVDVMVDMETLGNREDAIILSACVCVFDRSTMEVLSEDTMYFDIRQQLIDGRRVEEDTQDWWCGREDMADQLYGYAPLSNLRSIILNIQVKYYVDKVWSRGCTDWHILQHVCGSPFKYYQFADLRTLDIFGVEKGEAHHTAEGDVAVQMEYLKEVLKRCNLFVESVTSPSKESSVPTADGK